jgi:hypothetical protein
MESPAHSTRLGSVLSLSLFLAAALCGCSGESGHAGRISVPAGGSVRILARHLKSDSRSVQWVWTVVGDRNWRTATQNGDTYRLSNSYPLNSTSQSGGTHVWEMSMTVQSGAAPLTGSAKLIITLRGSNMTIAEGGGGVDLRGQPLTDAVRVQVDRDQVVRPGSEVQLASIAGRSIVLKIDD